MESKTIEAVGAGTMGSEIGQVITEIAKSTGRSETDAGDVGKQFRQVLPASKTALCEGRKG
jgi:hypothetical protein